MSHNLERKARLPDYERACEIAQQLATSPAEQQDQTDTYFRVPQGRLKLREIKSAAGSRAELIFYQRPNNTATKSSHYELLALDQPAIWKSLFSESLGVLVTVKKTRRIWWHEHVRIHIDRVEGLGEFLEFEAVLQPPSASPETQVQKPTSTLEKSDELLSQLMAKFGLAASDGIAQSYSDLLLSQA